MKLAISMSLVKKYWLVLLIIFGFLIPIIIKNDYFLHLLINGYVSAILCIGWVLILRTGQFSIGQAAFYVIGAYSFALLTKDLRMPFGIAFFSSGIISAIFAFGIGIIILRLRGLYFAVLTLAFAEIVRLTITSWSSVLGGYNGIAAIPRPHFWGIEWGNKIAYYYFALIMTGSIAYITHLISQSRLFIVFRAVGSNETLAESLGIYLLRYKVVAFMIAGFFAGLAGSFYASYMSLVHPDSAAVWESITVQIKATIGGTGNLISGPLIGGILMTLLSEYIRIYAPFGFENILFGALVLLIIFFIPGGLEQLIGKLLRSKSQQGS